MYEKYLKRIIDFSLSLMALIVLSPVIVDINCTWYGIYERKSFLYARTAGKR